MNNIRALIYISILFFAAPTFGQHLGFGIKGGLLVGTQSSKRPLIAYHGDLFFESVGDWQGEIFLRRLGYQIQLGYHQRGASYFSGTFNNPNSIVASDVFHNLSLAAMIKGGFKLQHNFHPYYLAGVRLDGTLASAVINPRDQQGVTPLNFGFVLGGGIEWEPMKLPFGLFLEVSVHPDVTPQIFFAKGSIVEYRDPFNGQAIYTQFSEDYRVVNTCFEVSFGIKFRKSKQS